MSAYQNLSDKEVLATLLASVESPGDQTPYTWSGLGEKLIQSGVSPTDLVAFAENISSLPGGPLLKGCLDSGGFNFGSVTNRAIINAFVVKEPDWAVVILNAMLAIGAPTSTAQWSIEGLSSEPTVEQIMATRASIATYEDKMAFSSRFQSILARWDAGEITSLSAAFAEMEAGVPE